MEEGIFCAVDISLGDIWKEKIKHNKKYITVLHTFSQYKRNWSYFILSFSAVFAHADISAF